MGLMHYSQVNAMLLDEFLKEHRKVQELGREPKFSRRSSKLRQRKFRRGARNWKSADSAANRPEQSVNQPSQ